MSWNLNFQLGRAIHHRKCAADEIIRSECLEKLLVQQLTVICYPAIFTVVQTLEESMMRSWRSSNVAKPLFFVSMFIQIRSNRRRFEVSAEGDPCLNKILPKSCQVLVICAVGSSWDLLVERAHSKRRKNPFKRNFTKLKSSSKKRLSKHVKYY